MPVSYQILYWRDIPAQVKVRSGKERSARPLGPRFQAAIDEAAMAAGLSQSDDYLAQWSASEWTEREGDAQAVAEALAAELEREYTDERLQALAALGGRKG